VPSLGEHPKSTVHPPAQRGLHDAADHGSIGEHVEVVGGPFADRRAASQRDGWRI